MARNVKPKRPSQTSHGTPRSPVSSGAISSSSSMRSHDVKVGALVILAVAGGVAWALHFNQRIDPATSTSTSTTDNLSEQPNLEDLRRIMEEARSRTLNSKDAIATNAGASAWIDAAFNMHAGLLAYEAPFDVLDVAASEIQRAALNHLAWNELLNDRSLLSRVAPLLASRLSSPQITKTCCGKIPCVTAQVRVVMLLEELDETLAEDHLKKLRSDLNLGHASCLGAVWELDHLVAPLGDQYPIEYASLINPLLEPAFRGPAELPLVEFLETHASQIVAELAPLCNQDTKEKANFGLHLAAHLARDHNSWTSLPLFHDGVWNKTTCDTLSPITCGLLQSRAELTGALRSKLEADTRLQLNFVSVYKLKPGSHIHRHVGNNWRLNSHLGIVTPPGATLRVWKETRSWEVGRAFAFLDASEHEVIHKGTETRCVLNVVSWHPSVEERRQIDTDFAKRFIF